VPAALTGTSAAPTPLRLLPNGQLLGVADDGLLEFPSTAISVGAATSHAAMLSVTVPCAPAGNFAAGSLGSSNPVPQHPMPSGTPRPAPTPYPPGAMCLQHYGDINAVDEAGNIWIVDKHAQERGVALVKPQE
jgi:hypothetical protein